MISKLDSAMKFSENHWLFMLLMVLLSIGGAIFLYFIGQDALNELHPFQFFADSNTYHRVYKEGEEEVVLVGVASNYLGPLAVLNALGGNVYLVMLFNTLIFTVSVIRIANRLNLDPLKVGVLLLLSPLTISSLLSINKEIFIFPFIAMALDGYMRRSAFSILMALGISIFVRWQLTVFYGAILMLSLMDGIFQRRTLLIGTLIAISAVYLLLQNALEPVVAFAEASIESYDNDGSGLFEAMSNLQKEGGYFLAFPVKAAHLLFGMGLKFGQIFNPVSIYNDIFVSLHCTVSLLVCIVLLTRKALTLKSDLIYVSVVFLIVFCLTPVFAPRYLYPVFVVWVLVLAGAPSKLLTHPTQKARLAEESSGKNDAGLL